MCEWARVCRGEDGREDPLVLKAATGPSIHLSGPNNQATAPHLGGEPLENLSLRFSVLLEHAVMPSEDQDDLLLYC